VSHVSSWIKLIGNCTCHNTLMPLKQRRRSSSSPYFHLAGDELWGAGSGGGGVDLIIKDYYQIANVCSLDTRGGAVGGGGLNVVTTE